MTDLHELAKMLDEAKGASRELNFQIRKVTEGWHEGTKTLDDIPYTSSIDAALALVERLLPKWEWSVWRVGETCGATVYNTPEDEIEPSISSHAPTAPLAILKALVAALIAMKEKNDEA